MTLRRAMAWYLAALHLVVAAVGAVLLWPVGREWILVLELGLVLSAVCGALLLRAQQLPGELVAIGREWMKEEDFSHTFRSGGTADVQQLIELYNGLVARLREERIRHHEQHVFLAEVLEVSPSGILTVDHDGMIDTVNPAAAEMLGVAPSAVEGRRLEAVDAPLARALAELVPGESRLVGQHGRRRLRCTHSRFFDRGFPRSFFLVEDLTHELWASEKRAYNSLIRVFSHEVNNTIGATNSILHSALVYGDQLEPPDRDDLASALQVAIERTDHLNAFMRRYAEVVRVPEPVIARVDLVGLLERTKRLFEAECRDRAIVVELRAPEDADAVEVLVDETLMERVLVNVVRNAVEAVERDGWVRLLVGSADGRPILAVEDSGPGLSGAAADNLFTPFFSTRSQGQGVGLTLTREILAAHRLGFSLESPPGGPTRFEIVFGAEAGGGRVRPGGADI